MRKLVIIALVAGFIAPVLAQKKEASKDESWKNRKFTSEELKQYNGKDGKPVYVAVDGIVYDVSKSKYWKSGTHMKMHQAGEDLTRDIKEKAPQRIHKGGKILEKMPKVGVLVDSPVSEKKDEKAEVKKSREAEKENKEVKAEKK